MSAPIANAICAGAKLMGWLNFCWVIYPSGKSVQIFVMRTTEPVCVYVCGVDLAEAINGVSISQYAMPVFCNAAHISTSGRVAGNGFNGITLPVCQYKHCGDLISYDTFRVVWELTSINSMYMSPGDLKVENKL